MPEDSVTAIEQLRNVNRPTRLKAIGVVPQDARFSRGIEKRPGIQLIVFEVLIEFAVQIVAAVLGDVDHLRTGVAAIFGAEVVGNDLHFFDRSEVQRAQRAPCTGNRNIGCGDAIHRNVIAAAAAAVRIEAART
jgi:hypothetical protein